MNDERAFKKEPNFYGTLNMLIYDYLVKMKYDGTAKMFLGEAGISEFKPAEGIPLLAQWYAIFHDISTVRSGLSSSLADLSRIEGIMLRLENEKRRHQTIGRVDPTVMGHRARELDPYKRNAYFQPSPYDQRKAYEMYGQASPPMDPMAQFYDPRKAMVDYSSIPPQQRYSRYEEQMPATKTPGRPGREAPRYAVGVKSPSKEMHSYDPLVGAEEKPFVLKEIMLLKPREHPIVCSAVAREHKLLVIASSDRTISLVNLLSGKHEAITETGGKQITKINIKEFSEQLILVCGMSTNELLLIRYTIKGDARFEILGTLRGHVSLIVSVEVTDFIYSLDSGGIMRKWSLAGIFEREEVLGGDVVHICAIADNNFMLADKQRVYVYDFELNIEMMEVLQGQALEIKRMEDGFVVVFKDQVVWLNKRMQKARILVPGSDRVTTAALLETDLIAVSCQDAWFNTGKSLSRIKLHEANIVSLDSVSVFRKSSVVSCGSNGECKIWIKHLSN
jgi:hypothetical protein